MKILKTSTYDAMKNEIKILEANKLDLMHDLSDKNTIIMQKNDNILTLETEVNQLETALKVYRNSNNKLQKEIEIFTNELSVKQNTINELSETNIALIEERDELKRKLARPKGKNKIVIEEMTIVTENVCEDCTDCECGAKNEVEPKQSDDDDEQEND